MQVLIDFCFQTSKPKTNITKRKISKYNKKYLFSQKKPKQTINYLYIKSLVKP